MTKNELYKMHSWPHIGNKQRAKEQSAHVIRKGLSFQKATAAWTPRKAA